MPAAASYPGLRLCALVSLASAMSSLPRLNFLADKQANRRNHVIFRVR